MAEGTRRHTSGPWIVWSEENEARTKWSVCRHVGDLDSEEHLCVATVKGDDEDTARVNARLIAAAPDLLDALKWIAGRWPAPDLPSLYNVVNKAIAKAEGKSGG